MFPQIVHISRMKTTYPAAVTGTIAGARIAILQAGWHREHTDRMIEACEKILQQASCEKIERFLVPGCYELPLAAKRIAKLQMYDALVVFGVIVKGETDHYQVILETCIHQLGRVMYDFELPVIMEILPVHDIKHVIARSEGEHNKGIEAGRAAVEIVEWGRRLDARREKNN